MIFLSPFLLGIFKECPRCFWLHVNRGHKRPGGAFPSLPGGMDLIIKEYFDKYRGELPPEIQGKVRGVLFDDLEKLNRWRHWKTSLRLGNEEWSLYGAFDDVLVDNGIYIPIDFKTRASEAKEETKEFYQHQLDLYSLLLDKNGYKTDGTSYLIYFYPKSEEEKGIFKFEITLEEIKTSLSDAQNLINKAVETLQSPIPKEHTECEFCRWHKLIAEFG
jgi:CRISPR/Cas system-associated exonuclease Cas4 (RecB family)